MNNDDLVTLEKCERIERRMELERQLATTFIAQQKESIPAERTRLWNECLRLVDEIERLSNEATNTIRSKD